MRTISKAHTPSRRAFLAALALAPVGTAVALQTEPKEKPDPPPPVEPPAKAIREFVVPFGVEPAFVFRAGPRGESSR